MDECGHRMDVIVPVTDMEVCDGGTRFRGGEHLLSGKTEHEEH